MPERPIRYPDAKKKADEILDTYLLRAEMVRGSHPDRLGVVNYDYRAPAGSSESLRSFCSVRNTRLLRLTRTTNFISDNHVLRL
jgi:hypothetical protein